MRSTPLHSHHTHNAHKCQWFLEISENFLFYFVYGGDMRFLSFYCRCTLNCENFDCKAKFFALSYRDLTSITVMGDDIFKGL